MMHILHVIETLNPSAGGPSEAVRALFQYAPKGYTGEVVTLDEPGDAFLAGYPFRVHALGKGSALLGFSLKLNLWLRENRARFDGVMVNGLWHYVSFATWLAMRRHKPYVVFAHGMMDPYFKRQFPLKHLSRWVYWLLAEYWVMQGAYRVLFTTEDESRLARQSFWLHRWRPLVIPLGTMRPVCDEASLSRAFEAHCPTLKDKRFLLFLGRLHRKKGCDMLIRAFIKCAAKDPGLHLVMAGPDQQGWSKVLKEVVAVAGLKERVHWPGMLKGDVKWGAFQACEAFVLPSHQENFGIAVAEALACGKPVLLADKVNIAQEIAEQGAGLMEPDTQDGTDRLLKSWIALPEHERERMGERAFHTFESRYDMEKNAAKILQIFDAPIPFPIPAVNLRN